MRTSSPAPYGVPGLEFGATEKPYSASRPHRGQDHQWRRADPNRSKHVYAPVSGTVTAAWRDDGYHDGWGNFVDITVPTTDGWVVFARLAHHDSVSIDVGDMATQGETFIGVMGDTGDTAGVHLHEELWINGVRVNPVYYRTHDIPGTVGASASTTSKPFTPAPEQIREDDTDMPINFRSTTGGVSYTMIPGIQIIRHENVIAAALTAQFNTGKKWDIGDSPTSEQRATLGERQINDAEILVMLAKYGFGWASRDIARLPEAGKVLYADWIMRQQGVDISR